MTNRSPLILPELAMSLLLQKYCNLHFFYDSYFCLDLTLFGNLWIILLKYMPSDLFIIFPGDELKQLPVQTMSVVDMATSQEGIINELLTDIMAMERPEFEGQKKSIEGDALNHQYELKHEQVSMNSKINRLNSNMNRSV